MNKLFFFLLPILLLFSCSGVEKKTEDSVAMVYDEYLSRSDIEGIVPENMSGEDSLQVIRDYIDQWVRQKLLLHQAQNNLNKEQKDFNKQLDDYRNSLIIFTYEQELIRQNLDTLVTEKQIADYYNENKADFELKDNIVKVLYVKLNKNDRIALFRQLLQSENPDDRKKLLSLSSKHAVNSFLDDQSWLVFNDILKEIPIKTYNQEEFLMNNRIIEIQDSLYVYLMNIKGFMIKESLSPLNFEKENIRNVIINKRKITLVEEMQKNLFNDALKNGDFEIFIK